MDCDVSIFACFFGTDPGYAKNLRVSRRFSKLLQHRGQLERVRVYAEPGGETTSLLPWIDDGLLPSSREQ